MQAARGASLSPGDATGSRASRRPHLIVFAIVALIAYSVDQGTKLLAVEHLSGEPARPLVGDLLQLTFLRNPGAAFGTGAGFTPVISMIAIVATLAVLWFARRVGSTFWAVGLGMLLAGVVGNLTDRIVRAPGPLQGHVVDFLMLPNWPVFNVADIWINAAAVVIVIQAVRGIRLDGTREEQHAEPASQQDDAER